MTNFKFWGLFLLESEGFLTGRKIQNPKSFRASSWTKTSLISRIFEICMKTKSKCNFHLIHRRITIFWIVDLEKKMMDPDIINISCFVGGYSVLKIAHPYLGGRRMWHWRILQFTHWNDLFQNVHILLGHYFKPYFDILGILC